MDVWRFTAAMGWIGLTHRLPFQNGIESPAVALDDRPLEEDLRAQPALTQTHTHTQQRPHEQGKHL